MRRNDWRDLPDEVRVAVRGHTGTVMDSKAAESGAHSDITAALWTETGPVFIKGVRIDSQSPDYWSLRREVRINPHVRHLAPRLLWHVEAGGWLVAGFEYVEGRHPDYSPDSPDLACLARVVSSLLATPTPEGMSLRVESRWYGVDADLSPLGGDKLLHTDLNPGNLLIADSRVYVIDWGHVTRGADWVELGLLIPWLLQAGHTPAMADDWVSQFPVWYAADDSAVDLFSDVNARKWAAFIMDTPWPWAVRMAHATQQWADYWTARRSGAAGGMP